MIITRCIGNPPGTNFMRTLPSSCAAPIQTKSAMKIRTELENRPMNPNIMANNCPSRAVCGARVIHARGQQLSSEFDPEIGMCAMSGNHELMSTRRERTWRARDRKQKNARDDEDSYDDPTRCGAPRAGRSHADLPCAGPDPDIHDGRRAFARTAGRRPRPLPGEFVVILGPSGSGKSTLLNILGGLDAPTSGTVVFSDHNLVGAHDRELTQNRREHVGFVFQFYHLIPSLTARENVALVTDLGARNGRRQGTVCGRSR